MQLKSGWRCKTGGLLFKPVRFLKPDRFTGQTKPDWFILRIAHHHFTDHKLDYPWSSYLTCITMKPTRLKRDTVIGWFDDQANFKTLHKQQINIDAIEKWLEL